MPNISSSSVLLLNLNNLTFDLPADQGATPKLLTGNMEFSLVLLYSLVCLAGLVTNTALIAVILGRLS